MRFKLPPAAHMAISALLTLPVSAFAQNLEGEPTEESEPTEVGYEEGFGNAYIGSPRYKAQARETREQDMPNWNPYAVQDEPWFLQDDDIRKELRIDAQQYGKLYDDYQSVWQRHKERQAKLEQGQSEAEQSFEKMAERSRDLQAAFHNDLNTTYSDELTQPQLERMRQLQFQYRGLYALTDPEYVEYFDFNPAQRRQIAALQQSYGRRMAELAGYNGPPARRRQAFNQLRQQTAADLDGILNDRQRQTMQQMSGNRHNFRDDDYLGTAPDLDSNGNQNANRPTQSQPGSGIGTPRRAAPGSGIGTPGNTPQGSGIGTPGNAPQGSGIGEPQPNGNGANSGNRNSAGAASANSSSGGTAAGGANSAGGASGGSQ